MHRLAVRGLSRTRLIVFLVGAVVFVLAIASANTCVSAGLAHGLWVDQCPDGDPVLTLRATSSGLVRGEPKPVRIEAFARYATGEGERTELATITRFTPTVTLLDGSRETALAPVKGWKRDGDALVGDLEIPKVNDGDYRLRFQATAGVGTAVLDVPLPLYAPARVHVLTDRPLYEPGNTVKLRALALKGTDLTPLDERPGYWRVRDPNGEIVLDERAPAGAWGVVSGAFPLDSQAQSGTWTAEWSSGTASGNRSFEVRPFTLPRFSIEATTAKPFYRRGERPVVRGEVRYSSGAPVANASIELTWNVSGDWPPPTSWVEGDALPKRATAQANGRFTVELPAVPADLQGVATLSARVSATDGSGDRIDGSASVLLSEDAIAVTAITELAGGLIEGFNNRLYLRATTPDGRVLDGVTLSVKRLWEPSDKGTTAEADADGVGFVQLDPGAAVNVVIPPMPFRPPARVPQVTRESLGDLLVEGEEPSLGDRLVFDRFDRSLEKCTRYLSDAGPQVSGAISVDQSGSVRAMAFGDARIDRCVEQAVGGLRFGSGPDRLFHATWNFNDEDLPKFSVEAGQGFEGEIEDVGVALREAMVDLRDCAGPTVPSGTLPRRAIWHRPRGSRTVSLRWVKGEGDPMPAALLSCVEGRLKSLTLPKRAPGEDLDQEQLADLGAAVFTLEAPEKYEADRPQATVMLGYELLVTAKKGGETLGTTKVRLTPGAVPPLRMRLGSQLVEPGEVVEAQLLRGPDYTGELPEKATLTVGRETTEIDVDREKKTVKATVPKEATGWVSLSAGPATAYLFVKPQRPLAVALTAEKPRYAPGELARLALETSAGG